MIFFRNSILIIILFFSRGLFANNDLIDQDLFRSNIYYYEDVDNSLTFEKISSELYSAGFIKNAGNSLNFGFTKSTYWLKIGILNNSYKEKKYYLRINNPRIKHLEYFELNDQYLIKHHTTGNANKFETRPVQSPEFIFSITLQPDSEKTIFLKVSNDGEYLKLPIYFNEADDLNTHKSKSVDNIFYGIIILLILLNIFYLFSYKESTYLYFIFYILSIFLYHMNNTGALFHHVWPDYPFLNNFAGLSFITFAGLSFMYFTKYFFQVKSISKKLNDIYHLAFIVLGSLVLLSILFINDYWFQLASVLFLSAVVIFFGVVTSFDRYYASFNASIYYRISLFVLLLGLIIQMYGYHFQLNEDIINVYALKITLSLHLLAITFGLSERYRQIKIETDKIAEDLEYLERERLDEILNQKEILVAQREELLSQKEELEVQQEQLQEYTKELEKLSIVAKETQNIIYIFDKLGNLEWFNESFSSLLGLPSFDKEQETINIRDISFNADIDEIINRCIIDKSAVSYDSVVLTKTGENKWYQTTLTPILNEKGDLEKLIAIDTDITTLKDYEKTVEDQKKRVEGQKKEITDSIRYARRIQESVLPAQENISKFLRDNFIIYLPKDIVSGDFYWYHKIEEKHIIIAVDCTGHGVPGAFMSIIGTYLLNNIILQNRILDPAEILKQLNRKIKITLKADPVDKTSSDGMDVALAIYDEKERTIEFAGAIRPAYFIINGELVQINGDNLPVTSDLRSLALNKFTKHTIKINEGDSVYLFTDGIIDQFGGDKGKKFLSKRFKNMLLEISHLSMEEQKNSILNKYYEWKGGFEQVDDILIMGFRF